MKSGSIYGPVQDDLVLVEDTLHSLMQVDFPPLAKMMKLVLSGGGKQMRPALTLLAGRLNRYDLDLLIPVAASIELLHTSTLVHDDVIDGASTRRGRPTTNSTLHNSTAVMLGDYMFAHAAELVARTGDIRVIRLFAHTLIVMARGEIGQDMTAYDSRQNIRDYLSRIAGKTASLFATACEGGAIVSGQPGNWIQALHDYGYNLGMAFQIVDDILDFTGDEKVMGKAVGSDLMQGTLTLPALLFLERNPKDKLIRHLFNEPNDRDLDRVVGIILDSDIPKESYQMAKTFCDKARDNLSLFPESSAHKTLDCMIDHILDRSS